MAYTCASRGTAIPRILLHCGFADCRLYLVRTLSLQPPAYSFTVYYHPPHRTPQPPPTFHLRDFPSPCVVLALIQPPTPPGNSGRCSPPPSRRQRRLFGRCNVCGLYDTTRARPTAPRITTPLHLRSRGPCHTTTQPAPLPPPDLTAHFQLLDRRTSSTNRCLGARATCPLHHLRLTAYLTTTHHLLPTTTCPPLTYWLFPPLCR